MFSQSLSLMYKRQYAHVAIKIATSTRYPMKIPTLAHFPMKINRLSTSQTILARLLQTSASRFDAKKPLYSDKKENYSDQEKSKNVPADDNTFRKYSSKVNIITVKLLTATATSAILTLGCGALLILTNDIDPHAYIIASKVIGITGLTYHFIKFSRNFHVPQEEKMKTAYLIYTFMGMLVSPLLLVSHNSIPYITIMTCVLAVGPIIAAKFFPLNVTSSQNTMDNCIFLIAGINIVRVITITLGICDGSHILVICDKYGVIFLLSIYNACSARIAINNYKNGYKRHICDGFNYTFGILGIFSRIL